MISASKIRLLACSKMADQANPGFKRAMALWARKALWQRSFPVGCTGFTLPAFFAWQEWCAFLHTPWHCRAAGCASLSDLIAALVSREGLSTKFFRDDFRESL